MGHCRIAPNIQPAGIRQSFIRNEPCSHSSAFRDNDRQNIPSLYGGEVNRRKTEAEFTQFSRNRYFTRGAVRGPSSLGQTLSREWRNAAAIEVGTIAKQSG